MSKPSNPDVAFLTQCLGLLTIVEHDTAYQSALEPLDKSWAAYASADPNLIARWNHWRVSCDATTSIETIRGYILDLLYSGVRTPSDIAVERLLLELPVVPQTGEYPAIDLDYTRVMGEPFAASATNELELEVTKQEVGKVLELRVSTPNSATATAEQPTTSILSILANLRQSGTGFLLAAALVLCGIGLLGSGIAVGFALDSDTVEHRSPTIVGDFTDNRVDAVLWRGPDEAWIFHLTPLSSERIEQLQADGVPRFGPYESRQGLVFENGDSAVIVRVVP